MNRQDTTMLFEEVLAQFDNICYGIGFIVPVNNKKKKSVSNYIDEFLYLDKFLYPVQSEKILERMFPPMTPFLHAMY